MKRVLKILLIEDNPGDAELIQRLLRKEKMYCEFKIVVDRKSFLTALEHFSPDVILSDNSLPRFNAQEALAIVKQANIESAFIIVTGTMSEEFAVNMIKSGADDYILKDRLTRLPSAIESAMKQQQSEKEKITALQMLIKSEEKYRMLVDRISDGFIALDLNWRVIYINNIAESLLQRPIGSLTGKRIVEEFPEMIGHSFHSAYLEALQAKRNMYVEQYLDVVDKWVFVSIYPSAAGLSIFFRDITEQRKAEETVRKLEQEQLESKIEEQKKITRAMLQGQEKERNAIGVELHDNVNQILVGTNILLSVLKNDPSRINEFIPVCMDNIKRAIDENRNIAHELVTPDLTNETLLQQLARLSENMLMPAGLQTDIYHEHFSDEVLTTDQKLAIYRIAQEQCTNIIKHARANSVMFLLYTIENTFIMRISDDGQGLDEDRVIKGIGLRNITSRVDILGGSVNIDTAPGSGFALEIELPLH